MQKNALVCFLLFTGSLAFGQSDTDTNTITVNVSRSSAVQADQVLFGVSVQSGFGTGLDDVLAALQSSGITAANLVSVNTDFGVNVSPPGLTWTFSLTAPIAKLKETTASLTALQQAVAGANNGLTLSFTVQGTRVSEQLAQSQTCSLAGLVADAQAQGQSMAAAAGVTLGPIVGLSSTASSAVPASSVPVAVVLGFATFASTPAYAPSCAMTVKFVLQRF